jgi:hypothetical protein
LRNAESDHAAANERLASLYDNLADFREIAIREREHTLELRESLQAATIVFVPYFARDVYDFEALHEVGQALIGDRETNEVA